MTKPQTHKCTCGAEIGPRKPEDERCYSNRKDQMTPERINTVIAEWCGEKLFVIRKPFRDPFGYYRKNAQGYTGNINEAWKVTAEVAAKYTTGPDYENEPDKVIAEPAPIPNYYSDLNACREAETKIAEKRYSDALMRVIQDELCCGAVEARYKTATATAPQRCEALLRTIGRWEEAK